MNISLKQKLRYLLTLIDKQLFGLWVLYNTIGRDNIEYQKAKD